MGVEPINPGPKTGVMPLYYEGRFLRASLDEQWDLNPWPWTPHDPALPLRYARPLRGGQPSWLPPQRARYRYII